MYISVGASGGFVLASLSAGSKSSIEQVSLNKKLFGAVHLVPSVQWDGNEMTVTSTLRQIGTENYTGPVHLYRLRISGSEATVVGTTTLVAPKDRQRGQTWIQGKTLIGIAYQHGRPWISFWPLPKGGHPTRAIRYKQYPAASLLDGVTVSVSTSGRRIRR